ncbi:alpha/beta hydrolase [Gymnodinialimonas hymeniacidonis]|uniref:alpha/beta hydrolase n=1 Tax=Gymnodinialimonas hymeniacidonis TaxID=3126508 RepID=UPI0034C5EEF4
MNQSAPVTLAGAAPDRARYGLVLVHGRGGSAADILGLGEALGLPDIALAAPQAPGHSWWPTSFLAPTAQMEPFVQSGLATVEAAIEALALPRSQIALAGFSQGGCLALEFAARNGDLMATFGLSAGLVGTSDSDESATEALYGHRPKRFDYTTDLSQTPVHISVHEQDPHIPLARAQASVEIFRALGAETNLVTAPGAGHGILQEDVIALRAALNR